MISRRGWGQTDAERGDSAEIDMEGVALIVLGAIDPDGHDTDTTISEPTVIEDPQEVP